MGRMSKTSPLGPCPSGSPLIKPAPSPAEKVRSRRRTAAPKLVDVSLNLPVAAGEWRLTSPLQKPDKEPVPELPAGIVVSEGSHVKALPAPPPAAVPDMEMLNFRRAA